MEFPAAPPRSPGRPKDPQKAEAVLDAAWSLFLRRGVKAVAMEEISAAAGVSKGTLYAAYADKTAVFKAAVLREMERIEAAQSVGAPKDGASLKDTLTAFGIGITAFLASAPAVGFYNALASDLREHPELAAAFWSLGPGRTRANLQAILMDAADRGEISAAACDHGADLLFGMWQGFTPLKLALGIPPAETPASIAARVDRGVEAFLRAFGPRPGAPFEGPVRESP